MNEVSESLAVGAVDDIVCLRSGRRVESGQVADPLGDLVIGAGGVSTDSQSTYHFAFLVERHSAAEENQAAVNLLAGVACRAGSRQELRIKQVRLPQAGQRVTGLREGV